MKVCRNRRKYFWILGSQVSSRGWCLPPPPEHQDTVVCVHHQSSWCQCLDMQTSLHYHQMCHWKYWCLGWCQFNLDKIKLFLHSLVSIQWVEMAPKYFHLTHPMLIPVSVFTTRLKPFQQFLLHLVSVFLKTSIWETNYVMLEQ